MRVGLFNYTLWREANLKCRAAKYSVERTLGEIEAGLFDSILHVKVKIDELLDCGVQNMFLYPTLGYGTCPMDPSQTSCALDEQILGDFWNFTGDKVIIVKLPVLRK